MRSASPAELDLAARVRRGDEAAFAELLRVCHASVARLASCLAGEGAAGAEVVARSAWGRAVAELGAFDGAQTLPVWILRRVADEFSAWSLESRDDGAASSPSVEAPAPTVESAMASLPPPARAVVILRDVEGLRAAEVAYVLGLSPDAAHDLLRTGRRRLLLALTADGGHGATASSSPSDAAAPSGPAAWIETVDPAAASGDLGALYREIAAGRGGVASIHQAQSLNPRALQAHFDLYRAVVFQRSPLSRATRERLAVVVSSANECPYCLLHHAEALRQLGEPAELVDALIAGEAPAALAPGDAALLAWARAVTREPAASTRLDLEALRAQGLDDRALLDAALTVAYFAFVNRLVLMLGVPIEDGYHATCGAGEEEHE